MNPQHYPENGGLWGFAPEYLPRKAPVEQDPESHLQKHCEKVLWTLLWAGWIQRELQEILWCVVQEFKALNPWRPLSAPLLSHLGHLLEMSEPTRMSSHQHGCLNMHWTRAGATDTLMWNGRACKALTLRKEPQETKEWWSFPGKITQSVIPYRVVSLESIYI